ncbi:MAG: DUF4176 domain-containing protein [Bacilli bacterium]|nr:DUF4176 domain-containing protein [Bacilli bacterium]
MKSKLLPIGSVLTVKGQDVMICAYLNPKLAINNDYFDYACCLYPNGMSNETIVVKKEDIERIKFIGFQDARFEKMKELMEKENE